MNKKPLILSIFSLFVLSGCSFFDFLKPNDKGADTGDDTPINNPEEEQESGKEEGKKIDFKQVGEFYGGVVENKKYIGYEFSKSENEINKPTSGVGEVNIFAFNDFHGAVIQNEEEAGLKSIGTFFKEKSQQSNTLILDQGDTWQGSFESNYQHGAIVQDVFNYAGVSLRTVGNHDFDWGLEQLKSTNNRKIGDDYIPVLASNVYDYKDGKNGTTQQTEYGKEYAIFTLDNGIKVGVVGIIGSNQITSICSTNVEDICFTDHIDKAQEMCDYLRISKECDIIVVSAHEGISEIRYSGLENLSSKTNHRYADLILGGHEHSRQEETYGATKYVQWDSNGRSVGSVKLLFDFATGEVINNETMVSTYDVEYLKENYSVTEPTIKEMVDTYLEETEPIASEVLSSNFNYYFNTTSLAYLMSEAIYSAVKNAGYNIDLAVTNYARTYFAGNTFTIGDLYRSFPFDNEIIIMDVTGIKAYNSLYSNMTYRARTDFSPSAFSTYKIAVIDYVGLHQNKNREYDYFPMASNKEVFKLSADSEPAIYRDILKDYLKNNPTKEFNSSDYTSSNPHFALD